MIAAGDQAEDSVQQRPAATPQSVASEELRTLGVHSVHYLAGFLGSMAFGLISFPIFTRIFSVAQFGTIDLAQKVLAIFTAGSKMGLQNAALRFYDAPRFTRDRDAAQKYYSTMCFGIVATSCTVSLLYLAFVQLFPTLWIVSPLSGLSYWIAILILVRALQSILCAFLRVEERTKAFNFAAVATKALTVAAVCMLLPLMGRNTSTYFAGTAAMEGAVVLILAVMLLRRGVIGKACFDTSLFRVSVAFGLPLVVYESAFAVLGSADRFLVRHYLGGEALGIYSVGYGLSQTMNDVLITPLNLALMPIYLRLWMSSGREPTIRLLTSVLDYYILVAAGVLCVATVASRDLVIVLSSSKYAGADRLIPMLLAGLLIYTGHLFVGAGLILHKRTLTMAGALVFCSVVNIGLNCVLLPAIGLKGGAVATLLSYLLCILLLWRASNPYLPLSINPATLVKCSLAAAVAWASGSVIKVQPALLSLAIVSVVTLCVYLGVLLTIDSNLRNKVAQFRAYTVRVGREWISARKQAQSKLGL